MFITTLRTEIIFEIAMANDASGSLCLWKKTDALHPGTWGGSYNNMWPIEELTHFSLLLISCSKSYLLKLLLQQAVSIRVRIPVCMHNTWYGPYLDILLFIQQASSWCQKQQWNSPVLSLSLLYSSVFHSTVGMIGVVLASCFLWILLTALLCF